MLVFINPLILMETTCLKCAIHTILLVLARRKIQNIYSLAEITQKIATIHHFRVSTPNFFMKLPMVSADQMELLVLEILTTRTRVIMKNVTTVKIFLDAKVFIKNNIVF